jgi:hypothetical protein
MVAWHRALAHLTRHSNVLIHLSYRGTESFWIHRFLSDQVGLSVIGSPDQTFKCLDSPEFIEHSKSFTTEMVRHAAHLSTRVVMRD